MLRKTAIVVIALGAFTLFFGAMGTDNTENPPTLGGIRYVALFVEDREAMSEFFGKKLGFRIRGEDDYVVYEVGEGQYFALVPKREELGDPGRMVVGFQVDAIDDYFQRVVEQGIQPLDPRNEDRVLERPVFRSWGAREFAVQTPEGDLLIFTRMSRD